MDNLNDQIKIFVEEIANRKIDSNNFRKAVLEYKSFLVNTKLITGNSAISKWLDSIINSSTIIVSFRETFGRVDLNALKESMDIYKKNEVNPDKKHYGHYQSIDESDESYSTGYERKRTVSSYSCGSSVTVDRC